MEEKINYYEHYFECWLQELQDAGIVVTYQKEPRTFRLFEQLPVTYLEQMKTKVKEHVWNLFQDVTYTADFKIVFNKKHKKSHELVGHLNGAFGFNKPKDFIFLTTQFTRSGNPIVYVDVKPPADAIRFSGGFGSARDFPLKQRILYQYQDTYINKIIPYGAKECLFAKTFTPDAFYMTDKKTKIRAIKKHRKTKQELYKAVTITNFLNNGK